MPSTQVPPLWQGLMAHSSMLMLHIDPRRQWETILGQCSLYFFFDRRELMNNCFAWNFALLCGLLWTFISCLHGALCGFWTIERLPQHSTGRSCSSSNVCLAWRPLEAPSPLPHWLNGALLNRQKEGFSWIWEGEVLPREGGGAVAALPIHTHTHHPPSREN